MRTEQAYIEGFVKRAAEYGYTVEQAMQAFKIAADDDLGPWQAERAADMMATELKLKALLHNKQKHKGHYYLNPFVGGPITEGFTRLKRRSAASMANKHGIPVQLLGGGLLSAIRGDEELRARARDNFNNNLNDIAAE